MPRAQSSQPTIKNNLKSNAQLQPTIRSNSAYSYDEARAGYVERPYGVGSQWEQLARSLGQWDNTLLPFLQNRLDAKIEREASEAQVKFESWDEQNKNRADWKTFIEAHPEYQGDNPWAKIGFEKARLKGLGLDVNKYLNDRFSQSALVNETDMSKVNNQLSEWLKEYRKETGLKDYSDKLFLAKNYSQMEGEAKANVLSRHTAQLAQNTQKRLEESYLSATSKEIDAAFNPSQNGGHSFSAPDRRDTNVTTLCDIIDRNAQDMARHGYLDTNIADFKEKAVFTAYYNNGEDINILKAFDVLKQGKGVMSDLPGISEKLAQIKKQKRAEARANIQFAWAQDRRIKELEEERWTADSYTLASNKDFIATADSLRAQGCPERLIRPTLMNINSIRQETYKGMSYSPALIGRFAIAREMAKDGELNVNAIIAQSPEFGPERTNQLLDDIREANKEENKEYREARKQAGQRVYTTYSNDDGDVMTKQMLKYLGGQLSVEVEKGLEAKRYLSSILDNLYSEALRKEGGNIGPVLIDNLILEAEEKTQKYMKEKYPPAMNGTTRGTENTVPKAGVYQQTTEQPPQPTSKTASASKPQPPVNTAQAEAQAGKSLRLWLKQNTPDVLNTSYSTPEELLEIIKAQYPDKYEEAVSLISNFNAGGNR